MHSQTVTPMRMAESLFYFLVPGLAIGVALHAGLPALVQAGSTVFAAFLLCVGVPLLALFVAGVVLAWRSVGHRQVLERLRMQRPTVKACLAGVAVAVVMFAGKVLLGDLSQWIFDTWPPSREVAGMYDLGAGRLMGVSLAGNWLALLAMMMFTFANVFGEEVWWRGLILPRQQAHFGANAWWVHGLLWATFHGFLYWEVPALLPGCLALSYACVRYRSTWPGIIAHGLIQLPGLAAVAAGVLA